MHLREVGVVLDQLGLKNILESAICASEPFPKHLAGTLCHQGDGHRALQKQAVILTKGILSVVDGVVGRERSEEFVGFAICAQIKRKNEHVLAY